LLSYDWVACAIVGLLSLFTISLTYIFIGSFKFCATAIPALLIGEGNIVDEGTVEAYNNSILSGLWVERSSLVLFREGFLVVVFTAGEIYP
jgi:hypothetical protein